jgi:hypothetical protein
MISICTKVCQFSCQLKPNDDKWFINESTLPIQASKAILVLLWKTLSSAIKRRKEKDSKCEGNGRQHKIFLFVGYIRPSEFINMTFNSLRYRGGSNAFQFLGLLQISALFLFLKSLDQFIWL